MLFPLGPLFQSSETLQKQQTPIQRKKIPIFKFCDIKIITINQHTKFKLLIQGIFERMSPQFSPHWYQV